MKNKQKHLTEGSFALLFFVILGYTVKFYPDNLSALDQGFQTWLRRDLPQSWTGFFKAITTLGNTPVIMTYTGLLAMAFYYFKKWRAEAIFLLGNLGLLAIMSTLLKFVYGRPRPDLFYLISKPLGASYPSWHTASTMLVALVLAIIIQQRLAQKPIRILIQSVLIALAILVALSRIYLGVHYPTDILGGWLLILGIICISYPFYDQKRFEWRFQSKQK